MLILIFYYNFSIPLKLIRSHGVALVLSIMLRDTPQGGWGVPIREFEEMDSLMLMAAPLLRVLAAGRKKMETCYISLQI
jgi:hypothetical protein